MAERNIAVQNIMRFFTFAHLPKELQEISHSCANLAETMLTILPDDPELTVGLRKLLEAKDCFVRVRVGHGKT
jgi:hypothetical protein